MDAQRMARRPIRARQALWARAAARWLQRMGLRPNHISVLSVAFAALAGVCLILVARSGVVLSAVLFVAAAAFILLRLLCNLFDGMLAVEGGLRSKSGEIFNDLPDRLADSIILVAAGYSVRWAGWGSELGWVAALLAVITAYVRVLGGSAGATQHFFGPMAKQHRMAVITLACMASAAVTVMGWSGYVMGAALDIVVAGCVVTIVRRTLRIVKELESR